MPVAVNDVKLLIIEQILVLGAINDTGEDILKVGDIIRDIVWIQSLARSVRIMLGHVRQIFIDKASLLLMGEYSSKKSLSCQTSNFVNPYLTNFVLERYLR